MDHIRNQQIWNVYGQPNSQLGTKEATSVDWIDSLWDRPVISIYLSIALNIIIHFSLPLLVYIQLSISIAASIVAVLRLLSGALRGNALLCAAFCYMTAQLCVRTARLRCVSEPWPLDSLLHVY